MSEFSRGGLSRVGCPCVGLSCGGLSRVGRPCGEFSGEWFAVGKTL